MSFPAEERRVQVSDPLRRLRRIHQNVDDGLTSSATSDRVNCMKHSEVKVDSMSLENESNDVNDLPAHGFVPVTSRHLAKTGKAKNGQPVLLRLVDVPVSQLGV